MLTICGDDEEIFESLKAGANGYLMKKTPPAKVLEAIVDAHSGGAPMSSTIASRVVQHFQQKPKIPATGPITELTKREIEILNHLVKGFQYKEIADALAISGFTVRTHIENIYRKLHVSSRTEAVVKYLKGSSTLNVSCLSGLQVRKRNWVAPASRCAVESAELQWGSENPSGNFRSAGSSWDEGRWQQRPSKLPMTKAR